MCFRCVLLLCVLSLLGIVSSNPDAVCSQRRSHEMNKALMTCCNTTNFLDIQVSVECERVMLGQPRGHEHMGMGIIDDEGVFQPENFRQYLKHQFANDPPMQALLERTMIDECIPMLEKFTQSQHRPLIDEDAVLLVFTCVKLRLILFCPEDQKNGQDRTCLQLEDFLKICTEDMESVVAFLNRRDLF